MRMPAWLGREVESGAGEHQGGHLESLLRSDDG
jgi:hypothetical protein